MAYGSRLIRGEINRADGSVFSTNSMRKDLDVSFPTVKNWVNILERFYSCFRISPFGGPTIKAVKKEQKLYMWDWAFVEDRAARFENLIALHLLRLTHWLEDVEGEKVELRYFRSPMKHEVDFILTKKQKPWIAIEVKLDDRPLDPNLKYFIEHVQVPYAFQISLDGQKDTRIADINGCKVRFVPAALFLANLP